VLAIVGWLLFPLFGFDIKNPSPNTFSLLFYFFVIGIFGAWLPDADSKDRGSHTFHTAFKPIAYLANVLEYPISLITHRQIGHRESLHTVVGITITSIVLPIFCFVVGIILLSLIGIKIDLNMPTFQILLLSITGLFIGQLSHLIGDFHFHLK
jgi:hypothetical protein